MSCDVKKINRLQPIEVLARINGWQDTPIVVANVASMTWSAFILEQATGDENPVTGYQDLTLTPIGDYVEDVLILDSKWDEDTIGYNFHFVVPGEVFEERKQLYLIRVSFDMVTISQETFTAVFLIQVK